MLLLFCNEFSKIIGPKAAVPDVYPQRRKIDLDELSILARTFSGAKTADAVLR